jgi:hypothetical protein
MVEGFQRSGKVAMGFFPEMRVFLSTEARMREHVSNIVIQGRIVLPVKEEFRQQVINVCIGIVVADSMVTVWVKLDPVFMNVGHCQFIHQDGRMLKVHYVRRDDGE